MPSEEPEDDALVAEEEDEEGSKVGETDAADSEERRLAAGARQRSAAAAGGGGGGRGRSRDRGPRSETDGQESRTQEEGANGEAARRKGSGRSGSPPRAMINRRQRATTASRRSRRRKRRRRRRRGRRGGRNRDQDGPGAARLCRAEADRFGTPDEIDTTPVGTLPGANAPGTPAAPVWSLQDDIPDTTPKEDESQARQKRLVAAGFQQ